MVQSIIFETIVHLIIIACTFIVYRKTKELFDLSLQKGIKYFSNAFLIYSICFSLQYLSKLICYTSPKFCGEHFIVPVLIGFLSIYTSILGGFYLAYSLMWRKFEKDRAKRSHPFRVLSLNIIAIAIASFELFMLLRYQNNHHYLFFGSMILLFFVATLVSYKQHKREKQLVTNPFLSAIGIGFGVYMLIFISNEFSSFLPTLHYYAWGIVPILCLTIANNVLRLAK